MLISAHAFGGVPAEAIHVVLKRATPYVSEALLEEYRELPPRLLAEGKITRAQFQTLVSGIAAYVSVARVVKSKERMRICRDPKDDMALECCRAARATVLITGDRDLLDIAAAASDAVGLRRLRIMNPRAYLASRRAAARKRPLLRLSQRRPARGA